MRNLKNFLCQCKTSETKTGFTLAEVLITLTIIGVVAALTIPNLVLDNTKRQTVSELKKNMGTFNQAFLGAVKDNGPMEIWTTNASGTGAAAVDYLTIVSPYLKMEKTCGTGAGCFPNSNYLELNKSNSLGNFDTNTSIAKGMLPDGTLFYLNITNTACNSSPGTSIALTNSTCGVLGVDVNGYKSPNVKGIDLFSFWITRAGIIPIGNTFDNSTFASNCKNKTSGSGETCSAWVIYNGNTDYLYCSDLDWDTKISCKGD